MDEITLYNVDVSDFDQVVAAVAWFERLDDVGRYLAIDKITDPEQWDNVNDLCAAAILYVGANPRQTVFGTEALQSLSTLLILREQGEF